MPSNAQELERLFVTILLDDSKLQASFNRVVNRSKQVAEEVSRAFSSGASKGFEDSGARVERSAQRQKAALDPVKSALEAVKNETAALRNTVEAGTTSNADAIKRFDELRISALAQAGAFDVTSKEYRGFTQAAAQASRSIATLEGRTTKLGFSANNMIGVSAALRQNIGALGPAGIAATRGLDTLQTAFGGFVRTGPGAAGVFGALTQGLSRLAFTLPIIGAAASGVAIAGLVKLGNAAATTADAIDKGARSAGLSIEAYQELRYAFDQNGVAAGRFDTLMQGLNQRLGQAADGSKAQAEAFERLGVSIRDGSDKIRGTEDVLVDVIARLEALPSAAERASAGMAVLGREGRDLGALLDSGVSGVEALREAARSMGLVVSGSAVLSLVQYKDAMATLSKQFETARVEIVAAFIPLLTNVLIPLVQNTLIPVIQNAANAVTEFMQRFLDQTNAGDAFRADLAASLESIARLGSAAVGVGAVIGVAFQGILAAAAGLGAGLGALVAQIEQEGFLKVFITDLERLAEARRRAVSEAAEPYSQSVERAGQAAINAFTFDLQSALNNLSTTLAPAIARGGRALGSDLADEATNAFGSEFTIDLPPVGSLAAFRAQAAEARKEFEAGVTDEARAGALQREAIAQAEIDKILATFNVDPFADARIWTDRLTYELRAGLKDSAEVFDLLTPRVESLRRELEEAYLTFGIDSEQFREALGKLEILENALKGIAASADIRIKPTVEFDVNLTSPGEVRRYVEELRRQLDELMAEAQRANRAGDDIRASAIGEEMLALSNRIDTLTASFGNAADASERLADSQAGLRAFEDFGGGTVGLTAFQQAVLEIDEALQAALGEAERFSRVLGDGFDVTSASAQAFRSALERYVRLGLDETDAEVQALVRSLEELQERLAIEAKPPSLNTADLRSAEDVGFFPTGALTEFQTKLNEIIAAYEEGIRSIEAFAGVMGDDFDDGRERAALLQRTIRAFTDLGLDASTEQVAALAEELRGLLNVAAVDVNAGDAIRASVSAQLAGAAAAAAVFGTESELAAVKTGILENAIKSLLLLDPAADITDLVLQWEMYTAGVDISTVSTRDLAGAQNALGAALKTLDQLSGNVPSQFDTLATAFRNAERAGLITKETLEELLAVIEKLAKVDAATQALNDLARSFDIGTQIMDGLTTAIEGIRGGDLQGALSGLTSIGVAIGTAIGGPAAGALIGAIGGAIQAAVGLFQSIRDIFTGDSKARRDLARNLSGTVAGAFRSGIIEGLKGGEGWQENLKNGVREAVVGALVDAFIQAAVIGAIFQPFIDEFTKILARSGTDAAFEFFDRDFERVLDQSVAVAEEFVRRWERIFPRGSGPDDLAPGASATGTIELPNATVTVLAAPQWALELNRSAERMSAAGDAMLEAANLMQSTFREGITVNTQSSRGVDAYRAS